MKAIKLNKGFEALVDDQDYDRCVGLPWYVIKKHKTFYARRTIYDAAARVKGLRCTKPQYLHQFITGIDTGVDHISGNGLDNQRKNLRSGTESQNGCNRTRLNSNNTSGFMGVTLDKRNGRWIAQIMIGRKCLTIGRFNSAVEAAVARDKAAKQAHGKFATFNFP